ncbi:MAG: GGDEF domain-containing protein [Bacteroidota bacterium]
MTNNSLIVIYILAGISIGFILASIVFYKLILIKYNKDELTGLLYYSSFRKIVSEKSKNRSKNILLIIDIDNFKQYNQYSYLNGDAAIVFFSNCLIEATNKNYICGRYRIGDEFGIIIPSNNTKEIKIFISKLQEKLIVNSKLAKNKYYQSISFSYGFEILSNKLWVADIGREAEEMLRNNKSIKLLKNFKEIDIEERNDIKDKNNNDIYNILNHCCPEK